MMEIPIEIPKPQITEEEFKRKIEYRTGDIVQIIHGKNAGKLAVIIGSSACKTAKGEDYINYHLKLADNESTSLGGQHIKFVKESGA